MHPVLLMALCALLSATAVAMDMDTLPDAPYAIPEVTEPLQAQYGLHPVEGMTLPVFLRGARPCTTELPRQELWVPAGAGEVDVQNPGGSGASVVFADMGTSAKQVFGSLPTSTPLRAAMMLDERRPSAGQWCGPTFEVADGRGSGPRFDFEDLSSLGDLGEAIDFSQEHGSVVLKVHPSAPWGDVAVWLMALHSIRKNGNLLQGVQLKLARNAAPLPHRPPLLTTVEAPTSQDVLVERDGRTIARFETPTRLVHATGQVLATYAHGAISMGIPDPENDVDTGLFEGELVLHPEWRSQHMSLVLREGQLVMEGVFNAADNSPYVLGRVQGDPNPIQEVMLRLGLLMVHVSDVYVDGWSSAEWDGTLRVRGVAENGRWSVEGVQMGGDTFAIADLSRLDTADGEPQLYCRARPDAPDTVYMSMSGATIGDAAGLPVPVGTAFAPLHSLDHPQVRAACIAAAASHEARSEPTDEVSEDVAGGEEQRVVGGVLGGTLGERAYGAYLLVHHSKLRLKRQTTPLYPEGAEELGDPDCRMRVFIDDRGVPRRAAVAHCPEPLQDAARDAVLSWRWRPYKQGRSRRAVETVVRVSFEAPD